MFTHGFVLRALLWLQQRPPERIGDVEMAHFCNFQQSVSAPNCAVLRGSPSEGERLQLSSNASVAHLPAEIRTE